MASTIDMQDLMYLNLFEKITRISTRFCFKYNETIFFCVPKSLMSRAIGEGGKNVRRLSDIIHKKIKIISAPNGLQDARFFIESIVNPVKFKGLEIKDDEIIITGSTQTKAAIIGRNKRRLIEMQRVVSDFFNKDFRVA
ncbi:hypothetical protein HY212_00685 [Candidatus Pacearchaeota archaeon]|nr:hypothetical protein [Candidatus Pacearchaeota archaeon]